MNTYTDTTSSPLYISKSIRSLRIIAIGEGGTGGSYSGSTLTPGVDGSDTTFIGITAGGGEGGGGTGAENGGVGGTATFVSGTLISSSPGDDGDDGSGSTVGSGGDGYTHNGNEYGDGTDGTLGSVTTPQSGGGLASTPSNCWCPPVPSGDCPTTERGPNSSCEDHPVPAGCGNNCYRRICNCYYPIVPASTAYYAGSGGGAGSFIEVELQRLELSPYIGNQTYSVNENGSGLDNGLLELIYYFLEVYIKTSLGWQLVKNIYVKQSDVNVGWTTSVASIKNYGW